MYSALHWAVISHNAADVMALLEGGADIDEVSSFGWTPLHIACSNLLPAIVDTLLHHNADIDIVDRHGRTALQLAMSGSSNTPNRGCAAADGHACPDAS